MPVSRRPATTRGPRAKSASARAGAANRGRGRRAAIANPSKRARSATRTSRAGTRPRTATARKRATVRSGSRKAMAGPASKRGSRGQLRSIAKRGRATLGRANRAGRPKATRPASTLGRQAGAPPRARPGARVGTVTGRSGVGMARTARGTNDVRSAGRGGRTRRHEDERYRGGPTITGTGEIADRGQYPRDDEERREAANSARQSPRWKEEGVSASAFGEGADTRGYEPGTRLRHKQAGMQGLVRSDEGSSERGGKAAGHEPYPQEKGDRFGGGFGQRRHKRNTGEEE